MNGVIFPLFDADGIRLTSLRLGPPSAVTYAAHLQKKGRPAMAFNAPRADADFNNAIATLHAYASANLAALGLVAADLTPLTTAKTDWDAKYPAHLNSQAQAQSDRQAKDDSRAVLESAADTFVLKLEGAGQMDDAERQAMGLNVRDTQPTPSATPTTRPVGQVDTAQRLRHTISWVDETTPGRSAKPAGVMGAELFNKIGGPPPTDDSDVTYLATDTRSPYLVEYDAGQAGQVAHYMLRWVNTRGERGPWSETISATIGA